MMRAANSAARVFFPAGDLPDWATAGEGIGLWANGTGLANLLLIWAE